MKIELTKERVDNIFFNTLAERLCHTIEKCASHSKTELSYTQLRNTTVNLIEKLWCADIISDEDRDVLIHDMLFFIDENWDRQVGE